MDNKVLSLGALKAAAGRGVKTADLVNSENVKEIEILKDKISAPVEENKIIYTRKVDAKGRAYSTGKRKNAISRVWIKPGSGLLSVNGRPGITYFSRPVLQMLIEQPFKNTDRLNQFDVWCTVKGGGLSGQAGAVRHGISKALVCFDPGLRPILKQGGFLTRDSRIVERKKYGQPKARRRFQFSKR